ncbi:MAG: mechanosensitive ion channel family protein, partial [Muribaculaceae bacterium]|nr:mechanosensitive ion channel family protein [Muribaculaceae bacterium]
HRYPKTLLQMYEIIHDFLSSFLSENVAQMAFAPVTLVTIAILAYLAYLFCHSVVAMIVRIITKRTVSTWDDDLLNDRLMKAFSQLAPAILVAYLLPEAFNEEGKVYTWLTKLTEFYIVWAFVHLANRFLQNLYDAFDKRKKYKIHTLRGVFQILKLMFICVGIIVGISILFDKSPLAILTAFGASAAVLMLVFKDTILGLVAGVQLTANDMLKKGDWIVVEKSGANGEVIDVSLTTVKIRNWDNSVTTVPPYTLISESFQNFKPMQQSGGRRVMRAVCIDINSVKFCTSSQLGTLKEKGWIADEDIEDASRTVNIGLLRRYLERYLATHPDVETKMTHMVRQLHPTPQGIPLELYFFTIVTEWVEYEHIQSEIFNHVYAVVQEFGLAIYQAPSGSDISSLGMKN